MTKQQQLIMDIIYGSYRHLSAEQIFTAAKEQMPHIAFGTIYRNLSSMVSENMIRRIPMGEGEPDRYDRNVIEHGHAVCTVCGEMCDVDTSGLRDFLHARTDVDFNSFELCLKYICANCRNEAENGIQHTI